MLLLRIVVGLVALLIALAGAFWYGVYVFGPSGRPDPANRAEPIPTRPASQPVALTPFERRQRRRTVVLGASAVIGGLVIGREALDSIRTGIPIHTLHGPDMNGWVALAGVVFIIALGVALVGVGLGIVRLRNPPPGL